LSDPTIPVWSERLGDVWRLTLNRPEALNAFDRPLLGRLGAEVAAIRSDRTVRCLIVTGAGAKAFSAGADLKERRGMTLEETRQYVHLIRTTFDAVARLPFPTIAAINGVAFGGGMELALACDLRLMAEPAEVGLTEVAVGIMPGAGGTQRLPRLVGPTRAKDMIFTARRIGAVEAERIGLVNAVVPAERLAAAALELAQRVAAQAPLAVRQAKHAIDAGLDVGLASGLDIEAVAYSRLVTTQDRVEGLAAFAEKRKPIYRGE
jgi:enoyl-CoA hydratase/carnithine racemase